MMGKLLKWLALFVLAIIFIAMVAVALNWERFNRLLRVNSLFTEELIVSNFSAMDTMFETTIMPRGDVAATPLTGTRQPLPERFAHDGEIRGLADPERILRQAFQCDVFNGLCNRRDRGTALSIGLGD